MAKTANSVTTTYLVDDLNPTGYPQVMDEIVGGVVKREYTYGLQRISENQNPTGAWTPNFYGYDGAESVRYLTSTTGAVTDTYGYDAFGNEVDHTGTTPNNYLYRGEQYDPDLSLYYLRARYMNPLTGRFLSRDPEDGDPADPASLQKYAYADADPVDGIDPTGWSTLAEEEDIDTGVELREAPKPKLPPGAGWGALALLGLEVYCLYESEHVATTIVIGANGSPQAVQLTSSNCSARVTSPSTGPGPGPTPGPSPGPGPGPGPKGPPKDPPPSAKGRMRIQLQFGTPDRGGITVKPATQELENDDPPGVTLAQVGEHLTILGGLAQAGLPSFPKTLKRDIWPTINKVEACAARYLPYGTGGITVKTICSKPIGKSGWRIDLDQLFGNNLTQ